MKTFTLLIITSLLYISSFAQGVLECSKPLIELKNLLADDQPKKVTFTFKNSGNQPVILNRITPMSSLLQINYDKAPLLPGKTRDIEVSFIPADMAESFDFRILVYSTARNNRTELEIKGNIVDNPAKPELLYKFNMDGVKFKTNSINFNRIYTWQVVADTLTFINTRKDSVAISVQYQPSHLQTKIIPAKIAPGKSGNLIVTYDAPKKNDYGYTYESIILSFNNERDFSKRLSLTANLVEDFSKLNTRQMANAPVASFAKTEINFGEIKEGEKTNCDFVMTNNGKSQLIVRKTKASCGCTAITLGNPVIEPGKSTTIRATFDSAGKTGRQYKSVTIITNDPKNPEILLTLTGDVKK